MHLNTEWPVTTQLDKITYNHYEHSLTFLCEAAWATIFGTIGAYTVITNPFIGVCEITSGLILALAAKKEWDSSKECWKKERRLSHIKGSSIALCLHLGTESSSTQKLHFIKSVEKANLIAVQRSITPYQISAVINLLKRPDQNNQIKLLWLNFGDEYSLNSHKFLNEFKSLEVISAFQSLSMDHPHYIIVSQKKIKHTVKNFLPLLPKNSWISSPADELSTYLPIKSLSYEINSNTLEVSFSKKLY